MSNTSITNLQIPGDTFQVWINKTNELVDLVNANVVLAGLGTEVEVTGDSKITGTFTANTFISNSGSIDNLSVLTLQRSIDAAEQILSTSPIKIQSSVENIFDLQTSAGNRPLLRMINGGNARWVLGLQTDSASSGFGIGTEGASTPQITITQGGRLVANELQGNGSLITNINANNISSGTINVDRLPDLNASKITAGVFDVARIPDLNTNKITDGTLDLARIPNLPASKTTTGTFGVARIPNLDAAKINTGIFDSARIPNLDADKITSGIFADARLPTTVVRTSRRLLAGAGITIGGNGDLSVNRTISAVQLTQAQATNSNSTITGAVSGQRLSQSFSSNEKQIGINQTWQNVSRVSNTWYQNTTERPIMVFLRWLVLTSSGTVNFFVNPSTPSITGAATISFADGPSLPNAARSGVIIVPPNHFYLIDTLKTGHAIIAMELR